MFEAPCDENIELDRREANQLLMNKWGWSDHLIHTRNVYYNYLKK